MTISILRLEAPMVSFGAPIVSEEGLIQPFPALSTITGLLANALGYDRREPERHERLQKSIQYAVREDQRSQKIVDYQTVDLGSSHMLAYGRKKDSVAWTTWGHLDQRAGSGSSKGTAQRNREYWADAHYTVALYVEGMPVSQVENALNRPERPLFVGRKACPPSSRIFQMTVEADSPKEALQNEATFPDGFEQGRLWYEHPDGNPFTDLRDWSNQIHVGERFIRCVTVSND